jgi:hypothetical protein
MHPQDGVLWVLQVSGAILSLIAGLAKLSGDEEMIQMFTAIGLDQWLRYVGFAEFLSAILLLTPAFSGICSARSCYGHERSHSDTFFISEGSPGLLIVLLLRLPPPQFAQRSRS